MKFIGRSLIVALCCVENVCSQNPWQPGEAYVTITSKKPLELLTDIPDAPLEECQGACTGNEQCGQNLVCKQKVDENFPCSGNGHINKKFCVEAPEEPEERATDTGDVVIEGATDTGDAVIEGANSNNAEVVSVNVVSEETEKQEAAEGGSEQETKPAPEPESPSVVAAETDEVEESSSRSTSMFLVVALASTTGVFALI